ncbi:MAG: ATP-dependent ligase [Rhodospirillales bacterium]|nr:ATP-dependent ligase [Rhodospirillales bacterium]
MASRNTWKGFLKLSLVSCPVQLQPATTRGNRIAFHNLNKATHNRIEMRPHDAESGDEVDRDRLVRGYEVEEGRFVLIEEQDLEAIETEASRTIDLTSFVDRGEIDPIYLDTPYYLAPDGPVADETFRVVHAALEQRKKAGIGRVVLGNRERIVVVETRGEGMLLTTLRSAEEVRADRDYFAEIPATQPDDDMVALATDIIEAREGKFDPKRFEDRRQAGLRKLIDAKIAGQEPVAPESTEKRPSATVVDLMAALKRSLQEKPAREPAEKPPAKKPPAKRATRRKPAARKA